MSQVAQENEHRGRVYVGAFVDREQRQQLVELARKRDRSVSSIVRRALAAELEREREQHDAA
jgi:predicted transcriptional regulator